MIKIGDKVKIIKSLDTLKWYHDKVMIVEKITDDDIFGREIVVEDSFGVDSDNCIFESNLYNANNEIRLKKLNSL